VREDSVHPRLQSGAGVRPLNFARLARVCNWLSGTTPGLMLVWTAT
jgi:hypothetical protein